VRSSSTSTSVFLMCSLCVLAWRDRVGGELVRVDIVERRISVGHLRPCRAVAPSVPCVPNVFLMCRVQRPVGIAIHERKAKTLPKDSTCRLYLKTSALYRMF
jgi:hypothetical protein